MKKIIGWILLIILTVLSILIVKDKSRIYEDISSNNSDMEIKVRYKGLKKAVDFTMNDENIYVAFPRRILCIPLSGEPYNLLEDENLNITSLEICGERLFYISNNSLMNVHTITGESEECLANLPSFGDYKDVILKAFDDRIYLALGAATNSGVVGEDNFWIDSHSEFHDIPSYDVILNENTEGAFVEKSSGNTDGQVIKGESLGTSSIIEFNSNTYEYETYAWGLRNVKGMDITSDGRLFVTVGGYENRGSRPIKGDSDYIYEVKKGCWYGFPDFSGGDPLNSPRFKNEKSIEALMKEHPMNPPGPSYQHNILNSLSYIVVDNGGIINKGGNNYLYFYDNINRRILYSYINGAPKELIEFKGSANISRMKLLNESLYILDGENGFLFTLGIKNQNN